MGKERAYSAKPTITSGDQCQASLPGLALLLSMGAGEAGGGKRDWWGQARPTGAVRHRPHARAHQHQTLGKPPGQIPSQHKRERKIGKDQNPNKDTLPRDQIQTQSKHTNPTKSCPNPIPNTQPSQSLKVKIRVHILKVINRCRHLSCKVNGTQCTAHNRASYPRHEESRLQGCMDKIATSGLLGSTLPNRITVRRPTSPKSPRPITRSLKIG